jgi:hypothetical protein
VSEAASIDHRGALEAVERILNRGGEAEGVVQAVLEALNARGVPCAKLRLAADGRWVDGPTVGRQAEGVVSPVVFEGREIGSLELSTGDSAFVERVAVLISPYVARLEADGDR